MESTSSPPSTASADDHKARGNELLRSGSVKEAIASYTEAISLDGKKHVYYSNRSAAYLQDGQYDKALEDATACTALAPDWPKGYNRAAVALHHLERYEECIQAAKLGLKHSPGNAALKETVSRAKKTSTVKRLSGVWHGVVHQALGGYTQELEFVNDRKVIVRVLGTTVEAEISLNCDADPQHLDMSVPSQPGSPVVKHIFRFTDDGEGLELVSPYLVPPDQRPTLFTGPGVVIMRRGTIELSGEEKAAMDRAAAMSVDEKTVNFLKETVAALPTGEVLMPFETDDEATQSHKMSLNVRFQSSYHKIKSMYGDNIEALIRQYLLREIIPPTPEMTALVDTMRQKMIEAKLMPPEDHPAEEETASQNANPPSSSSSSSTKEYRRDEDGNVTGARVVTTVRQDNATVAAPEEPKQNEIKPAAAAETEKPSSVEDASSSDMITVIAVAGAVCVALGAVGWYLSSRRRSS